MLIHSFEFPLPNGLEVKEILALTCDWIAGSDHYVLSKSDFDGLLEKMRILLKKDWKR